MKKLISSLANRVFWWATERVYEEGMMFGYTMGVRAERGRIIEALEDADSACSGWAVGIIEETK